METNYFWISRDGEVFPTVQDISDSHLIRLKPFMERRRAMFMQESEELDEDLLELIDAKYNTVCGELERRGL